MLATASSEICGQLKGNCRVSSPVPTIISLSPFLRRVKGGGGGGVREGSEGIQLLKKVRKTEQKLLSEIWLQRMV